MPEGQPILRMREWRELHRQLRLLCAELD